MSFVLLIVCWFSVGQFIWLRDRESGSSYNLCLTCFCFSLVYRGRSLLIRDRESVLWLKLVFEFCVVLFRWIGGREVCDSCMILRLGVLRNMAQLGCWGLGVLFWGCSLWVSSDDGRWWIPSLQCFFFFWSLF